MAGHPGLPGAGVGSRQGSQERVHIRFRRRMAEGKALRTAGGFLVQPHGQQDMGRAWDTGGAGGAGGRFHAGKVKQEKQRIPFAAWKSEVRVPGKPARPGRST